MGGYFIRWTEDLKDDPNYVSEDNTYAKYSMNVFTTAPIVAATFNTPLIERQGQLLGEEAFLIE